MAKIERKYLAHYINTAASGEAVYERLGKDLEEFSPEMSATVETTKNILGQTSILISSYEKTGAVETYFAEQEDPLFTRLQSILDEDLTLDACKCAVVAASQTTPLPSSSEGPRLRRCARRLSLNPSR